MFCLSWKLSAVALTDEDGHERSQVHVQGTASRGGTGRTGRTKSWPHKSEKSNPAVALLDKDDARLRCQSCCLSNIRSKIKTRQQRSAFSFAPGRWNVRNQSWQQCKGKADGSSPLKTKILSAYINDPPSVIYMDFLGFASLQMVYRSFQETALFLFCSLHTSSSLHRISVTQAGVSRFSISYWSYC